MADVPVPLMRSRRLVIAANLVYAVVLLTLGLLPDVPQVLPGISDRLAHATAYSVQAILLFTLFLSAVGPGKAALFSAIGAVAFGGVVETLQYLQPARSVEIRDLVANTVGAVLAASTLYLVTVAFATDNKR